MHDSRIPRALTLRGIFLINVNAWYFSLHWMLGSDPSAFTFKTLLPMLNQVERAGAREHECRAPVGIVERQLVRDGVAVPVPKHGS